MIYYVAKKDILTYLRNNNGSTSGNVLFLCFQMSSVSLKVTVLNNMKKVMTQLPIILF